MTSRRAPVTVPTVSIGGLAVSGLGLGCMGMSQGYGASDWDEATETIHRALDLGITFLDTADVYGAGHNEVLVGRAIASRRDEVQLATKFGIDVSEGRESRRVRGSPAYVKQSCVSSLLRLGVEHIDLYYLHRPAEDAEIEETVGAMADLVAEGKVRYLGLSEVDDALLRRASSVHPIAAVQSEYSLWTRDPEITVLRAARELGVALVPFAPLGRGFLTGSLDTLTIRPGDMRAGTPRFTGPAADSNQAIARVVAAVAARRGATPAQVALTWVRGRSAELGVPVVPIPGTKRRKWLEENVGSLDVRLDADDLSDLDPLATRVAGARY